jgi:hypothetical protein
LIEIEDVVERDAQSGSDLFMIVLQAEAHLEDLLGGDKIGGSLLALTPMKLEDEGFVGEGELHDVGAIAFLSLSESRLGFGVKSTSPCGENFVDRVLALGTGRGYVDMVG